MIKNAPHIYSSRDFVFYAYLTGILLHDFGLFVMPLMLR